jgi:hypothetical protein
VLQGETHHDEDAMKKTLTIAALFLTAVTGTAFAADNYALSINAPSAKASAKSTATIKIEPKGGYKMNLDYPTKLTLTAPDGVKIEKTKLTKADTDEVKVDKSAAAFEVKFTAESKGKKSFTGEVKFAVCTENDCQNKVEKVAFDVEVK